MSSICILVILALHAAIRLIFMVLVGKEKVFRSFPLASGSSAESSYEYSSVPLS